MVTLSLPSFSLRFDPSDKNLSKYKFNGNNTTLLFKNTDTFVGFRDMHDFPSNDIACGLFAFTFEGHAKQWCHTFFTNYIHSFDHMFRELCHAFVLYDRKALNKKKLKLRKSLDALENFHDHFLHYCYEFPKDELDWKILEEIFHYIVHISKNPHELDSFEPLPTCLVLELLNLIWTRLLSQVTSHPLLIKQL